MLLYAPHNKAIQRMENLTNEETSTRDRERREGEKGKRGGEEGRRG